LPLSLRQSRSVASLKINLKKLWLSNELLEYSTRIYLLIVYFQ
jgi:hypothetical protein